MLGPEEASAQGQGWWGAGRSCPGPGEHSQLPLSHCSVPCVGGHLPLVSPGPWWPLCLAGGLPSAWACFMLECGQAGQQESAPAGRRARTFCSKPGGATPSAPASFLSARPWRSVTGCNLGRPGLNFP